MNRTRTVWINALFLALTFVANALGGAGVINGLSQKDISDKYMTLITPSGSTFSIWGVIYTLLLISIIVMIVRKDDVYYQLAIDRITVLFRLSCILNISWIILFSYLQIVLSTLFIFALVIVLALMSVRLLKINDSKHYLLPLTFGLYTGWVFIATVLNVAVTLVKVEWGGFGISPEIWAGIIMIVAILLVLLVLPSNKNFVFPLPVAWGYFGIYQNLKSPTGFDGAHSVLEVIALAGMAVLIGIAAIQLYRNRFALIPRRETY